MVWQLEKGILDHILSTFYRDLQIHYLDFACGTGRILSYLEERTKYAIGVDLSPSMLEVALKNNKSAEIIKADLTKDDVLGERKFNLITAFRFFPNAQPELRKQAMQVLNRHIEDNGYIVFNNHKNVGSARNRLAKLFGHREYSGMSIAEVKSLLVESSLEIVKVYHICVFPVFGKHTLVPLCLLRPIEVFLSRRRLLKNLGENLIFVCRKANKKEN